MWRHCYYIIVYYDAYSFYIIVWLFSILWWYWFSIVCNDLNGAYLFGGTVCVCVIAIIRDTNVTNAISPNDDKRPIEAVHVAWLVLTKLFKYCGSLLLWPSNDDYCIDPVTGIERRYGIANSIEAIDDT